MRTITDEVGAGTILINDEGQRSPAAAKPNNNTTISLTGQSERVVFGYRPNEALPQASVVSVIDNGRTIGSASNDNIPRRVKYHLQVMANNGELGKYDYENHLHWIAAERFRKDCVLASGEPVNDRPEDDWREVRGEYLGEQDAPLAIKDRGLSLGDDLEFEDTSVPDPQPNATAESNAICFLYAQQLMDVMRDVLGHDLEILKRVIVENRITQTLGEDDGGYTNRACASAYGKALLRAALRNLARFYENLDRLEQNGLRPPDVWPLIGTKNYPSVIRRKPDSSYLNQSRGPVIKRAA
ncbi:hypothetical protein V1292_004845 [Bradyrhizobium sp. AZCC 1719]|uniref:hypothetical protein n=1 Tax=Bradyrhizobium sp. AZCC 1719 TaxID=3117028 RepID=UPI002FF21D1E